MRKAAEKSGDLGTPVDGKAKVKAKAKVKPKAKPKASGKAKPKAKVGVRGKRMAAAIAATLGVVSPTPAAADADATLVNLVDQASTVGIEDYGFPAPAHLKKEKAEIWRETVGRIMRLKSLDLEPDLDRDVLEQYVTAAYDFREANAFIEKHGHSYENAQGNRARHPESTVAKEAQVAMERLGTRLGLNPRARQIMNISRPSEKDAFDDDDD